MTDIDSTEVARRAHALLTRHPAIHNQRVWFQNETSPDSDGPGRVTSPDDITPANEDRIRMCAASAVCLAAGYTLIAVQGGIALDSDGDPHEISEIARDLLGLTTPDAGRLFYGTTNPEALEALRQIAGIPDTP